MNFLKSIASLLKKALAPGFEATKKAILGNIDWAIQAIPGVGVQVAVDTLKTQIANAVSKAHLPDAASMLVHIALAGVDWDGLAQKPAENVVAELKRLRTRVEGARL